MRLLWVLMCFGPMVAQTQTFTGGPGAPAVVELYTSEGCSSCPPADRWLASLRGKSALFESLYPLAFHVDYWDYLGWPDRFARAAFSARQRRYHDRGALSAVYTPGVLVNGREWRGWRAGRSVPSGRGTPGVLRLALDRQEIRIDWEGERSLRLHLAWLGMGLSTRVKAGENDGRTLAHDFVVLERLEGAPARSWTLPNTPPRRGQKRTAVVAWVAVPGELAPVQAAGGYVPPASEPGS